MRINYEAITLQDCIDNFEKKNSCVVLHNGQVVGFEKGEET